MADDRDAIVLGAGPSGLGATLALARAGARVTLIEAEPTVGGLCRTRRRGELAYDIGGHIPFVRDRQRLAWLEELLGPDLHWVPRPVVSVRAGALRAGRYLDQRPTEPPPAAAPFSPEASAREELARLAGDETVEREMRRYLEKVDGVPLERIPADRARRLRDDQAAPDGFWFPTNGIGQLMDAMAHAATTAGAQIHTATRVAAIAAPGGRVAAVRAVGPEGPLTLTAPAVVAALPAGRALGLVDPPPPGAAPAGPPAMRAVAIVYLAVSPAQSLEAAWIQVDDPAVPFARCALPGSWSAALVPGDRTLFACECYCAPADDDPVWGCDDRELAARCATALVDRLGWVAARAAIETVEVLRLPQAYPLPDRNQLPLLQATGARLAAVRGLHHVPGAAVIEAIEGGERAARTILSGSV